MCDEYNDHAKKYFDTEDAFILDRVRNYIGPINNYFKIKEDLDKGEISENQRKSLEKQLEIHVSQCQENLPKILSFLESQ